MKLNILLCNLVHSGIKRASEAIPLGIGYIASYVEGALPGLGVEPDIELVTFSEEVEGYLKDKTPKIAGFSNFIWNTRLARRYADRIKEIDPGVLVIFGGPDFPADDELQRKYLDSNEAIDFYVIGEGEIGTANVVRRYVECAGDIGAMKKRPIEGAVFLDGGGDLVKPGRLYLIPDLGSYPSPILDGKMDRFLVNGLTPMIQSMRGCPYSCTYCNEGINIPGSVRNYPIERVLKEITYLEKKHEELKGASHIIIADSNFGQWKDDHKICDHFMRTKQKSKWPTNMELTTGKSNKERMIENLTKIGDSIQMTLALQSMHEPTLRQIKRKNFSMDELLEITRVTAKKKIRTGCELIIPMPEETFESYLKALKYCVDLGMKVHTHTLVLLMETEMAQPETVKKYEMESRYRVLYRCIGEYSGKKVIETEKVCVSTKDYSFEDYIETRTIGCVNGIFVLNEMFAEMRMFIMQKGLSTFDWLMSCYEYLREHDSGLSDMLRAFRKESADELWDGEEELFDYFEQPRNYKKLVEGKIGRNLITTYQGIAIKKHYEEAVSVAKNCLLGVIKEAGKDAEESRAQVEDIATYLLLQNSGCFDIGDSAPRSGNLFWDISAWGKDGFERPLSAYKQAGKYAFERGKEAQEQLEWYVSEYGNHPEGYGRILVRINPSLLKRTVRKI